MTKLAKSVITLVAACALTGCSLFGGTKVSAEKFQEAVDKIEAHQYEQATVSYNIDIKGTGTAEDSTEKSKGKIVFKYTDGKWTTDSDDKHVAECRSYIYTIKGMKISDVPQDEDASIKTTTTYYTGPLKVSQTRKGESSNDSYKYKVNSSYTYTFDKYGYVTKATSKVNDSAELAISMSGISLNGGYTLKGTETFSISYK